MGGDEPRRSCIGCRQERGKSELLRFVLDPEGRVVPDIVAKLPGRGAYTCPDPVCVRAAIARKQFARAFRGEGSVAPADTLIAEIRARLEERISSYVALANKAGKVVSGSDTVMERLRRDDRLGLVILTEDISADIGEKVTSLAERYQVPCFRLLDKDRVGALLGKGLRSVAAIGESGFVPIILKELERYGNFLDGGAVDEQNPRV